MSFFPRQRIELIVIATMDTTAGNIITAHPVHWKDQETSKAVSKSKPTQRSITDIRLTTTERQYFNTCLKRKEKDVIEGMLHKDSKCLKTVPLRIQVLQSALPETVKMNVFNQMQHDNSDKYRQWVQKVLEIPVKKLYSCTAREKSINEKLAIASDMMEEHITGHNLAKCEVLKLLCQQEVSNNGTSSYAMGLEGPPGTGKTQFAKVCAGALGRPFVSIPLGGAGDTSFLLGNVYTYEGSREGRLVSALIEAKCCNPVIHFDELDKVSTTDRGAEVIAVLIHLIDPSTNSHLRDRYFHGVDLDFSRCTFIFSYNSPEKVNPVLLDRIKRISMPAPTKNEKKDIVRKHFVPRMQRRLKTESTLSDECINKILSMNDKHCGMRGIEKQVEHVMSTAQLCLHSTKCKSLLQVQPKVSVTDGSEITIQFLESLQELDMRRDCSMPTTMYT